MIAPATPAKSISHGFLQSVAEPLVALASDGKCVYLNTAAEELLGQTMDCLADRDFWEAIPALAGTRLHEFCLRVSGEGAGMTFDEYFVSGVCFEVELRNAPDALWICFRDVTARRQAEVRLRLEEQRYRTLFDRVPTALYRTAPDGSLLDVNPALLALLGYPDRETLMSVNAADVYVDPLHRRSWQELLATRDEAVVFIRDRRFDGSIIWVRDTARAVRDEQGGLLCYEGMLEDVTRQREAEDALRESEERFRLLADASDDVIWDWDAVTGEVRWNDALRRVLGYPPDCMGRGIEQSWSWWSAHIHTEDRAATVEGLERAIAGDASSWRAEYRFRRLDGTYAKIVDRMYIGRDPDGKPARVIGAMLDASVHRHDPPELLTQLPARMPLPPTSDATLLQWISQGDVRALDDLYARHSPMLFTTTRSLVASVEEAEEIVADIFIAVWAEAGRYSMERGSVTSWLNTMCRSRAAERTRKARRRERLIEDSGTMDAAEVLLGMTSDASAEDRILVNDSLARLPELQRQVIELAYFNGMSHSQIAESLNQPLGTVKTRVRDGIAKLRVLLQPDSRAG